MSDDPERTSCGSLIFAGVMGFFPFGLLGVVIGQQLESPRLGLLVGIPGGWIIGYLLIQKVTERTQKLPPVRRRPCPTCGETVSAPRGLPEHWFHLYMSLVTAGIWLIPWIILCLGSPPWHCGACGMEFRGLWPSRKD